MEIERARSNHFALKWIAAVMLYALSAFSVVANAQAVQLVLPYAGQNIVQRASIESPLAPSGDTESAATQNARSSGDAGAINLSNAAGIRTQATRVQFNASQMQHVRSGGEMDFTLPNARRYTIVVELAQSHGDGIASWTGYLKDHGKNYRAIITAGPAGTYANIQTPTGEYRLVPGPGHDWLIDMAAEEPYLPTINLSHDARMPPVENRNKGAKPRGEPTIHASIAGVNTVGLSTATPAGQAVVDFMFVVTTGLANRLGGNLMTRMNFLVTTANDSYAQSEIAITMRLVYVTVVDYPDTGDDGLALDAITPVLKNSVMGGAGVFSSIETLRNTYGADVVSFQRNGSDFGGSGIAWVPNPPESNIMYSVITGCVQGCETVFLHEVGHNMGNSHDRATVAWEEGGTPTLSSRTPPYAFGYYYCDSGVLTCNSLLLNNSAPNASPPSCTTADGPQCITTTGITANNFGTIMSYFNPKVLRFSNPNVTCGPTGGATRLCGVSELANNSANNALAMNNNRFNLSAVKSTAVATLPGSIQFTSTAFSASKASGTLTATMSRIGGSAGAISATFATSNGSGISGIDFSQTVATVSWANGDTANKTISIPLVNDGTFKGGRAFTIALSGPVGAAGVYLGFPSVVTGIITEDWPPGGTFPSNFGTSAGSLAWTVATDQVFEGANSLRSAKVISSNGSNVNSDLTFTGNFNAGIVAFAYRVSSYERFGFMDFLVDNTVVFSDTGESGWKTFSYQITAGTHTLIWRYKNRLTFPCNQATQPPQGGAACADRAWIDALVLPLALANSTSTLSASVNPSSVGQSVTLTATVAGSAGSPTGYVVFRDGGTVIAGCSAVPVVSSSAKCVTSALTEGAHSITGQYSGNATYTSSTSSALAQTVRATARAFPLVPVLMLLLL